MNRHDEIRDLIKASRKLFSKLGCVVIDVTKRSVEETAAKIIQLVQEKRNSQKIIQ